MSSANRIEKVAIVGATGRMGGYFAAELAKTGMHTVTALTRKGNKKPLPDGVQSVEVDYDSHESMVSALRGQQFLAITLSVMAPQDLHGRICAAAAEAGVPYIMPNLYTSYDPRNEDLSKTMVGAGGAKRIEDIEKAEGDSACIAMVSGFWYEWSLAYGPYHYGFDIPNRTVTFLDDGKAKICTSTWDQCARALASLLKLPISGASPCVADWKNAPLYITSFRISQRDMLDSLNRVLGTTDADWTILYEGAEERFNKGTEEMKKGDMRGFAKLMYSRIFYANGDGDFARTRTLANEALGLPVEDLDEATKRTVDMVTNGWNNVIE